jgi:hypothetical protein
MYRLGTALLGDCQDDVRLQIGVGWARTADVECLVGLKHVLRIGICVGVHGHGLDAKPFTCADDSAGNFATIGDEDLIKHGNQYGQAMWLRPLAEASLTCAAHS